MRKFYLDNIRWLIVFSVLPFHVFFVSNNSGIGGAMPGMTNIPLMDTLALGLYNPWIMPLICLISGIAARFSLRKRSSKQFLKERVDKLLVPGTLGLLVYQWLTSYITVYATDPSTLENNTGPIASFIKYILFALNGTGPLWVVQVLFLCCCVLLLLRKIDKDDKLWTICEKINFPVLLSLCFVVWVFANLLDLELSTNALSRYRVGTCLATFLIGYYVISHEKVQELVEKKVSLLSFFAIVSTVALAAYLIINKGDYNNVMLSQDLFTVWYIWVVMLAVIGFSRRHLNKETALTRYMSKISYGLLTVHYPILLFLCVVIPPLGLPVFLNHTLIMILEIILSFVAYGVLKRIPIVRYCIFGYRKKQLVK